MYICTLKFSNRRNLILKFVPKKNNSNKAVLEVVKEHHYTSLPLHKEKDKNKKTLMARKGKEISAKDS